MAFRIIIQYVVPMLTIKGISHYSKLVKNYFRKFIYLVPSLFWYLIKCYSSLRFFFQKFTCVVLSLNACVILIKTHLPNVPECNLFTWLEVRMMQEAYFYGAISVAS